MSIEKFKRHLITAALPYANGPLHIGHLAGAYLPSDVYVRYLRLKKADVAFICGSDEHGAAITLRAKKEGITPQAIVDKYHELNKKVFEQIGCSFDVYSRTSISEHHKTSQDFFLTLEKNGAFTKQVSQQFFDAEANQFLADRYITGECPKCGYHSAYGDQCEKCGSTLSPTELINPVSTLSGTKPILKETAHWYLEMESAEAWLREWIEKGIVEGESVHNPSTWRKHVVGQCLSWLDGGLQSRAMTRDLDWGVPVPVEGAEGKVLYVWLDAPIGYITATKIWAEENGKNWEPYWKDKETNLLHFIAKDNIVFHCIIFPILLKNHGEYILPQNVPANAFLNLEGDKISTSRNWAVWVHEYLDEFPGMEDVLRYVLISIGPESKDSEFTWKDFQARNNNELVAILGNFVNRAIVLTHKYYEGKVPQLGELTPADKEVVEAIENAQGLIGKNIEQYKFREALAEAMQLARVGNKYLAETEPWKLIKTNPEAVKNILNLSLQLCANLTVALEAFLPFTAQKLREMLSIESLDWNQLGRQDLLIEGHVINQASLLFTKVEDATVDAQIAKLEESKKAKLAESAVVENPKDDVSFEQFSALDLRLGSIVNAEKMPKTKKLLQLTVDLGFEQRTIVSGIAEYYKPEEIIGKQVLVLVNLAPKEIRGVNSHGMILMAENALGELSFLSPEKNGFKAGNTVR
ncbi:MAG: methionine--tRNA ligase [Luteibaculaceae bacterium]